LSPDLAQRRFPGLAGPGGGGRTFDCWLEVGMFVSGRSHAVKLRGVPPGVQVGILRRNPVCVPQGSGAAGRGSGCHKMVGWACPGRSRLSTPWRRRLPPHAPVKMGLLGGAGRDDTGTAVW